MLQSETGYIDARPLTTSSAKSACNARPDHTYGSKAVFEADSWDVRFALDTRHWLAPIASGSLNLRDPYFRVPVKSIQESPSKGTFAARQMGRSWPMSDRFTQWH